MRHNPPVPLPQLALLASLGAVGCLWVRRQCRLALRGRLGRHHVDVEVRLRARRRIEVRTVPPLLPVREQRVRHEEQQRRTHEGLHERVVQPDGDLHCGRLKLASAASCTGDTSDTSGAADTAILERNEPGWVLPCRRNSRSSRSRKEVGCALSLCRLRVQGHEVKMSSTRQNECVSVCNEREQRRTRVSAMARAKCRGETSERASVRGRVDAGSASERASATGKGGLRATVSPTQLVSRRQSP